MWDSKSLQCLKTLEGHEDNVRVLAVGQRYLFSGSWDKTIRVWDLQALAFVKVQLHLHLGPWDWLSGSGDTKVGHAALDQAAIWARASGTRPCACGTSRPSPSSRYSFTCI